MEVAAVAQQFTQGNLTITGNNLDVAINGNGFFTLTLPDGTAAYTRSGNFKLDKEGNMVTNDNAKVMGFRWIRSRAAHGHRPHSHGVPRRPSRSPPSRPPRSRPPSTLDARATDAAGDPTATPPSHRRRATHGTPINGSTARAWPGEPVFPEDRHRQHLGRGTTLDDPRLFRPWWPRPSARSRLTTTAPSPARWPHHPPPVFAATHRQPHAAQPQQPACVHRGRLEPGQGDPVRHQVAVSNLSQDGYTSGELTGINIENNGMISHPLLQRRDARRGLAHLSSFRNTQGPGLGGQQQLGGHVRVGQPVVGTATDGSFGSLRSGALEDSNVDLTAELVNMMTAQRATRPTHRPSRRKTR